MQTPEEKKASARKTCFGFIQFEERFNFFLPKNGPCVILLSYQYYQKPFSSKFSLVLRNLEQVSYENVIKQDHSHKKKDNPKTVAGLCYFQVDGDNIPILESNPFERG